MAAVLIKFFSLGVKTMAKPLAKRFEEYVMGHPEFRASVLRVVQAYHRWEVGRTLNNSSTDNEKRVFVGQMADDKALKMASSVVSEGFLFAVGSALIYLEYDRGRRKDIAKQQKETAFRQQLLLQQAVTTRNLEALEVRLTALEQVMEERKLPRRGVFGVFASGGA